MKKIAEGILFTGFMALIGFLGAKLVTRYFFRESWVYSFYIALIVLFWLLGLTYKKMWTFPGFQQRRISRSLLLVVFLFVFAVNHHLILLSWQYFNHLSEPDGKHWTGTVFVADSSFGHRPIPCSRGLLTLKYSGQVIHEIPIVHDAGGFRIPESTGCNTDTTRPTILYLGCSFTEGADCPEEETFAALSAHDLGATALNAGVSSYGFGQMLVSARNLIPRYHPDYVVVQFSPWLSDRAAARYVPSYGLHIPSPYFAGNKESVRLIAPAYPTRLFTMNWKYNPQQGKLRNFISFLFHEGFSAYAYDEWHYVKALFTTPAPIEDHDLLEKSFFTEVTKLAADAHSRLIVLNLGDINYTQRSHQLLPTTVRFAEADSLLWEKAHYDSAAYAQHYYFWGRQGKDSVVIDRHPSIQAHQAIAASIVKAIQ